MITKMSDSHWHVNDYLRNVEEEVSLLAAVSVSNYENQNPEKRARSLLSIRNTQNQEPSTRRWTPSDGACTRLSKLS